MTSRPAASGPVRGADRRAPDAQALYLDVGGTPTFAVLHAPAAHARSGVAALICPPFGFDEICAYRVLREWAARLAGQGHTTLRLSYPGTGDSGGGPRDPKLLDAWTRSVAVAAQRLAQECGVRCVVAIGLQLGGLLAYRATSAGAPIDGLILWNVPARGRDLARQWRAFSRMESTEFFKGLPDPPPPPDGELHAGGFVLSAETLADLRALDLSTLSLDSELRCGALLLGRDGIAPDARLREGLESDGVAVTVAAGDGYGALTSHPQESVVPESVVETVAQWLAAAAPVAAESSESPTSAREPDPEPELGVDRELEAVISLPDGTSVRERLVTIDVDRCRLAGVLTIPPHAAPQQPGALFLHAGAVRRIGPNRMWVQAARAWAARGVTSLRLDVEGIGDSDGATTPFADTDALHEPRFLPQVIAGIDYLEEQGLARRFAVVGLCSGAYWGLHAALADARIDTCLLVNPRAFVYFHGLEASRDVRRALDEPLTVRRLRRNITRARAARALELVASRLRRRLTRRPETEPFDYQAELDGLLTRVRACGASLTLMFAEREPLAEELEAFGQLDRIAGWPSATVIRIPVRDHTLRPIASQHQALAELEKAISERFGLDPVTAS